MGINLTRSLAAACAAVLLALPGAAAADTEPNDGITQTEGPLTGGTVYPGTISTANDRDWYAFYVTSQTQLDITTTVPADSPCGAAFELMDTDGNGIDDLYTSKDTTEHFRYTTAPGTNRYLLRVYPGCLNTKYQFSLNPAASIVSGPGRATPIATGEPNETDAQALGPLAGGQLYSASIDTSNDRDFFFFYTPGTEPFDLAMTKTSGCGQDVSLTGPGTENVDNTAYLSDNATSHIKLTPPGPDRYVLEVGGSCAGSGYEFRVDPPSALSQTLPGPVPDPGPTTTTGPSPSDSRRCASARKAVKKWKRAVRSTTKKLRQTRSRSAKRKRKRLLGAQKRALKRARDRVTLYC